MKIVTQLHKMVRIHIRRFLFETCGEVVREILRIWIPLFAI